MSYRGKKAGKSSNPFERMMQEQCNKPVAAKSAGIVGKWGATSFTSVRTTSDNSNTAKPRQNKFFKSRAENSENTTEGDSAPAEEKKESQHRPVRKDKLIKTKPTVQGDKKERPGWGSSSAPRPPLERSPLHPSRSPLHPSPSSNPSTTPPRSRSQSKKVEDVLSKENKHIERTERTQNKSTKDQMFDTLVSTTRKSHKEERRKRKQEEDSGGPRIKLKISVNRSPDKTDTSYKVVRKEDDLLSVCSQSSAGSEPPSSEASSDRTDVSNGFTHKRNIGYYIEQPSAKSSAATIKSSSSATTKPLSTTSKSSPSVPPPSLPSSAPPRASSPPSSIEETETTGVGSLDNNKVPEKDSNPPAQQLTKIQARSVSAVGSGGKSTRSRDKAVLLDTGTKSRDKAVTGGGDAKSVLSSKSSDEVSGTSTQPPPTNKRRLRGAAALSSVTPAPSSTSLIVCSATTTTTTSSSERFTKVPEPIHSSASAQNSLSSEDGDAPPPTKRRLRGAVAAPAADIKVESSTLEPPTAPSNSTKQKLEPSSGTKQSGAPATAVAAPQRKFFKSKAASSSVKIEPKKNEEATSLLKKESMDADFDLPEVKTEPFKGSSRPQVSSSNQTNSSTNSNSDLATKKIDKVKNESSNSNKEGSSVSKNEPSAKLGSIVSTNEPASKLGSTVSKNEPASKLGSTSSAARRSPSPEFSLELPELNTGSSPPPEPKPAQATYNKKRFFKSRNKAGGSTATETAADKAAELKTVADDLVTKEPPRVPPVSEHFVQVAAGSSTEASSASGQVSKILASVKSPPRSTRLTRNREATLATAAESTAKTAPTAALPSTESIKTALIASKPDSTKVPLATTKAIPAATKVSAAATKFSIAALTDKTSIPAAKSTLPVQTAIAALSALRKAVDDSKRDVDNAEVAASEEIEDYSSSQETLPPPEDEFKAPSLSMGLGGSKMTKGSLRPAKKTFFKSKKAAPGAGLQSKAMSLYRHNVGWSGESFSKGGGDKKMAGADLYDDNDFDDEESGNPLGDISLAPSKIQRVATYPTADTNTDDTGDLVTQVKCPKSYKPLFTVIKNTKKAHELNDHGEDQEFQDDVEYIVEGLNAKHRIPLRCLTAISLASKCMKPNFRMHLRAHSVVDKFFFELQDAPDNASLALCTATVMFVLSQDRLNMDLDRDSLKLMLNLLDTDSKISSALEDDSGLDKRELEKNKQKVIDICAEMKKMGHATSLNLELISADHLSMETLLSMTSQKSGEWFKEELRELGGIGHLARTVSDCTIYLTIKPIDSWTEMLKDKLKKATRILRVLENVSHENEENCNYLLEYKIDNQEFISILQKLFQLLDNEVQLNPSTDLSDKDSIAVVIREALFSLMRVHINLAYDYNFNAQGSLLIGRQEGMTQRSLRCLFIIPFWFVPLSKRFECLILSLTLLVNLVETCQENRSQLMSSMAAQKELGLCVKEEPRLAIEDLIQMYLDREELAKISEQKTDNILDAVEEEVQEIDPKDADNDKKDTIDETVQKLINKAGSHMESCIIAAYIGLVIGYLIKENDDYECRIREYLPSKDFKSVVYVLERLVKFMAMTSGGSSYVTKSIKGTQKMIKYLEKIDAEPESEPEEEGFELDTSNLDMSFDMTQDSINLPDAPSDYSRTQYGSQSIQHLDDF